MLRRLPAATRQRLTVRVVGPRAVLLDRLDVVAGGSRPSAVLVTGLAGGCAPDIRPGDVVVGDPVAIASTESPGLAADEGLRGRALRALATVSVPCRVGRLLTVGEVVASPAAKARCWQSDGALAVDMESAHVVAWARRSGLPALAVRAIADGPADDVPRALLGVVGRDGRMRRGAVVGLLRRPQLLGAAWRLGRRSSRALGNLVEFVEAFVDLSDEP